MSIVYENGLLRITRQPKVMRGEVELTPDLARKIAAALTNGRSRKANRLTLPDEALAAVGASTTEELTVSVEDGKIILIPTAPREGDACDP